MLVVGLTGGIGSGKSTVADLFAERGVPIIDADIVAREVTTPEKPAFAKIVRHFGQDIVLDNGTLNRAKLRQIIFNHPDKRIWLERLLHPLIQSEMERQINELTTPYCIAVVPLLLEAEFFSVINRILVVDAPEIEQAKRVILRDKTSLPDVEAILHNQASRMDRRAKAHDVITNDGTIADLIPQVQRLHEIYLKMGASS